MNLLRRSLVAVVGAVGAVLLVATPSSAAPNQQDQDFLVAAHQSNLAEIASGQAAVQQASTDRVRMLGQMLITDHQTLDQPVVATAQQLGVTLPDAPSPAQQAALAQVTAQSGQEFDKAWIALQISSHRATLAAGDRELATGSEPTVKALATAAAPVVQHHLDEALATAQQLGVPTSVPAGTGGDAATSTEAVGLAVTVGGLVLLAGSGVVLMRRRAA